MGWTNSSITASNALLTNISASTLRSTDLFLSGTLTTVNITTQNLLVSTGYLIANSSTLGSLLISTGNLNILGGNIIASGITTGNLNFTGNLFQNGTAYVASSPDVYIDKYTHVVIIECDENQHKDTSCENKRTMELFQDFGNRPIVFIRFNPDSYTNEENKKVLSSFKMHKTLDVPMIRDSSEWTNRLNLLKETITKWLNVIPKKELTNEYLFYDYIVKEMPTKLLEGITILLI